MKASYPWLISSVLVLFVVVMAGFGILEVDGTSTAPAPLDLAPVEPGADDSGPLTALPLSLNQDPQRVALGEKLFHEGRLSSDGMVSCAHCHRLDSAGVDRLPRSRGVQGQEGGINAPTVFNSGFNFRQFWDGRAQTLEDQVDGPLQHPLEMAGSWPQALAMLKADASYRTAFAAIYPDGITAANVKNAIATFERSLITPNARFDQYLRGNPTALNEQELAGYRLFKQIGCTSCHQGMNIGGNMYQKLGIMEDYFAGRGDLSPADMGRFNTTRLEEDRHFFRVPSLRNVALTPPYLHDASAPKLEDAISVMARYQLGQTLSDADTASIAAFLRTLTGEYLGKPLQ